MNTGHWMMGRRFVTSWVGLILLTAGVSYADGLELLIIKNQKEDAPADFSVMVRISGEESFISGNMELPSGGNTSMMVDEGDLIFTQTFADFSSLSTAGWIAGDYEASAFLTSGSTNYSVAVPSFDEFSFPNEAPLYLTDDTRRSITPSFEINGGWSWFGITNSTGEEVFSTENTNYNWMVTVDAGHALEYETPYTAIALTVWPWSNPYLGTTASLDFTTGFLDLDADGLPDTWEQQIIDHNAGDAITAIEDVLARDDYDGDGFSNQAEFTGGLNPVVTDTGVYNSLSEGLTLLAEILSSDEIHTGNIDLIDHCFSVAVAANPADYEARVYRAFSRLMNLINNETPHEIFEQFGISINAFLEASGELDMLTAPEINSMVDAGGGELLPALEASLADLEVIPSDWTGSIQVSTNDFPLDEDIYLDLADITFAKSALSLFSAVVRTARANSLNLDYDALQLPMSGPVTATITVDGSTNDWAGIPVQLYGEQFSLISTVRAARSASSLYLLVETRKAVFDQDWWIDGDLLTGQDQFAWFWLNNTDSGAGYDDSEINISDLNKAISGKILELEIPIPSGVTVSEIGVEALSVNAGQDYMWQSAYLSSPDNTPAEVLLQNHPSFLQSIRSAGDLTEARNNLSDTIDYFFTADTLVSNRTDSLMHFIEYDPTNVIERAEIITRIQDVQASLAAPVQISVTNDLGDVMFDQRVHIGAFFEPTYLTRAMLPEFHRVLSQPLAGTLPDPTFGGVLPDLAQTNLNAWFEDAIDDVDYDYLPNSWEVSYFDTATGASPDGDGDDDGFNNLQEFIGGSNPTNSTSVFRFDGAMHSDPFDSEFVLQWDALPGRSYSIWRSTNLLNGFELLQRGFFDPGVYFDADDFSSGAFYKVEAELY